MASAARRNAELVATITATFVVDITAVGVVDRVAARLAIIPVHIDTH